MEHKFKDNEIERKIVKEYQGRKKTLNCVQCRKNKKGEMEGGRKAWRKEQSENEKYPVQMKTEVNCSSWTQENTKTLQCTSANLNFFLNS